ncbi:MAG: serine/threonine protein kinase, partial [Chthonomonadales bacterium]|nr:serine/threonine protein kinase [Chthonomonadales bacterium]
FTNADLVGKSPWELSLMRNGVYARHGYRFHTSSLAHYFAQQSWYHPTMGGMDRVSATMSAIERQNATFVLAHEKVKSHK